MLGDIISSIFGGLDGDAHAAPAAAAGAVSSTGHLTNSEQSAIDGNIGNYVGGLLGGV